MPITDTFKTYYALTKPGMVRGNLLTATAGFFLALAQGGGSGGRVDFGLLTAALIGLGLVIASACVTNNYIDRGIDAKMERTQHRALVDGTVSAHSAILYASVLGLAGTGTLLYWTNYLTAAAAIAGFLAYVILYGWAKRRTVHGTAVGSISGAIPPVVGYVAVNGRLDTATLLLFLILVFWQMPHFYAIALYRLRDYTAAGIPVLPAVKGSRYTRLSILAWIAGLTAVAPLLTVFGYTGLTYAAVAVTAGLGWLWWGLRNGKASKITDRVWAKRMFKQSLLVISVLCLTIAIDRFLP